jgi:hypothetical protein
MDIRNSTHWVEYSPWERLVGTLAITVTAFVVRGALHPLIQPYGVFHFFIVAVLLIQYLFGLRMAILATVLSLALGEIFFVEPYGQVSHLTDKDLIISLNFVLVTLPAVLLLEKLQRSLYARDLLAKVNQSRMLIALRRENDRLYFGKKIDRSNEFIQYFLENFEQLLFIKTHQHPIMRGPAFLRECGSAPSVAHWQDWLPSELWEEISRPLSGPDWQAKRWERDFEISLKLPQGPVNLRGQVVNFQILDHQIEMWVVQPQ